MCCFARHCKEILETKTRTRGYVRVSLFVHSQNLAIENQHRVMCHLFAVVLGKVVKYLGQIRGGTKVNRKTQTKLYVGP